MEQATRGPRFIQKPWDNARLLTVVGTQVELGNALRRGQRLEEENLALRDSAAGAGVEQPRIVAESAAMKGVLKLVERIGPADANVLLTGENGSGKGVIARTWHALQRGRQNPGGSNAGHSPKVFSKANSLVTCAERLQSQADRVGRFELADAALYFSTRSQMFVKPAAKTPARLETGEFERVGSSKTRKVNVRVLSATNADLNLEVAHCRFRQFIVSAEPVEIHLPSPAIGAKTLQRWPNISSATHRALPSRSSIYSAGPRRSSRAQLPGNVRD